MKIVWFVFEVVWVIQVEDINSIYASRENTFRGGTDGGMTVKNRELL